MSLRVVIFSSALLLAGCHRGSGIGNLPASQPRVTMITEEFEPATIRAALARALASRDFAVVEDNPGVIVASYTKGSRSLKISIAYDPSKVTVSYVDSENMGATVDVTGQVMLDKRYSAMMGKLDESIKSELQRPGREAAAQARAESDAQAMAERQARQDQIDAEERQRAYELQLEREKTRQARASAAEARAMMPPPVRVESQIAAPGPDMHWTPGYWGFQNGRYDWIPGFWSHNYATQAPPAAVAENPGIPPSENHFWVRGHYGWRGSNYVWVRGHWDTARAGYTYVPAFWENRNGRWVHVEGRWISRGSPAAAPPPPPPPPSPPDCRTVLTETHHNATEMMFCQGAEPYCAAALLRRGHPATQLMFCKGVESKCAVSLINSGQSPTQLMNCKR